VKRSYRWFTVITGFAVPLIYYGLFAALVISNGYYFEYNYVPPSKLDLHKVDYWAHVNDKIFSAIGYWTAFTNCVACIVMALVIYLVFKLTRSAVKSHTSI
jgi:hypothetical protein